MLSFGRKCKKKEFIHSITASDGWLYSWLKNLVFKKPLGFGIMYFLMTTTVDFSLWTQSA
jgi:hypothetical protein